MDIGFGTLQWNAEFVAEAMKVRRAGRRPSYLEAMLLMMTPQPVEESSDALTLNLMCHLKGRTLRPGVSFTYLYVDRKGYYISRDDDGKTVYEHPDVWKIMQRLPQPLLEAARRVVDQLDWVEFVGLGETTVPTNHKIEVLIHGLSGKKPPFSPDEILTQVAAIMRGA